MTKPRDTPLKMVESQVPVRLFERAGRVEIIDKRLLLRRLRIANILHLIDLVRADHSPDDWDKA